MHPPVCGDFVAGAAVPCRSRPWGTLLERPLLALGTQRGGPAQHPRVPGRPLAVAVTGLGHNLTPCMQSSVRCMLAVALRPHHTAAASAHPDAAVAHLLSPPCLHHPLLAGLLSLPPADLSERALFRRSTHEWEGQAAPHGRAPLSSSLSPAHQPPRCRSLCCTQEGQAAPHGCGVAIVDDVTTVYLSLR